MDQTEKIAQLEKERTNLEQAWEDMTAIISGHAERCDYCIHVHCWASGMNAQCDFEYGGLNPDEEDD